MLVVYQYDTFFLLFLNCILGAPSGGGGSVLCTFHPYEEQKNSLGSAFDNSPGWCGIR